MSLVAIEMDIVGFEQAKPVRNSALINYMNNLNIVCIKLIRNLKINLITVY